MIVRRLLLAALVCLLVLGVLPACGGADEDSGATPEMLVALQQVDEAIVDEKYGQAESALIELKQLAAEARDAGTLSGAHASDILEAIDQLLEDIRQTTTRETTTGTETPTPSSTEIDDEKPKDKEKGDKGGKSKDKPPKSEGDPGNSENAPGHEDD